MKYFIMIFIIFSGFYYIFESVFNRITQGPIVEDKLKKPKKSMWGYASLWMLPVGGVAGVLINLFLLIPIFHLIYFLPLFLVIGGIIITIVELLFGLLFNKVLKLNIWDYSKTKIKIGKKTLVLNLWGQIDIIHWILWILATFVMFYKSKLIELLMK